MMQNYLKNMRKFAYHEINLTCIDGSKILIKVKTGIYHSYKSTK